MAGPSFKANASAFRTALSGAANGIIFIVAAIWRLSTAAYSGSVATVTLSWI